MLVYFEVNFGIFDTSTGFLVEISCGFDIAEVLTLVLFVFVFWLIFRTWLRAGTSPLKNKMLNTLKGLSCTFVYFVYSSCTFVYLKRAIS